MAAAAVVAAVAVTAVVAVAAAGVEAMSVPAEVREQEGDGSESWFPDSVPPETLFWGSLVVGTTGSWMHFDVCCVCRMHSNSVRLGMLGMLGCSSVIRFRVGFSSIAPVRFSVAVVCRATRVSTLLLWAPVMIVVLCTFVHVCARL